MIVTCPDGEPVLILLAISYHVCECSNKGVLCREYRHTFKYSNIDTNTKCETETDRGHRLSLLYEKSTLM